jgi:voltage-gated potassium channel Kch
VFTLLSRALTVFPPLYALRQGLRTSIVPSINLAQISEFSLVLIQVGVQAGQTTPQTGSAVAFAFVILAVTSTFMMEHSDALTRRAVAGLRLIGVRDLDHGGAARESDDESGGGRRIVLLGFYRAASSFLSELDRRHAALLERVCVVDFNPQVFHALKARQVKIFYGDISHVDTLTHAGVAKAEIVISSVPDSLLKGTTNEKLVRHVRAVNPTAKIVATADVFSQVESLYAAGADYVTIARLAEANELIEIVTAAESGLLADLRANLEPRLRDRDEVLP